MKTHTFIILGIFLVSMLFGVGEMASAKKSTHYSNPEKVEICHIPKGDPDNIHTISISESAVAAHFAHGDYLGSCEANLPTDQPSCAVGELWKIGYAEQTHENNPADEFNWAGDLNTYPSYTNPFLIGTSSDAKFPWTSHYEKDYATNLSINFGYLPKTSAEAQLTLSWSAGTTGNEAKSVWLDGTFLANITRTGTSTAGWWQNMPVDQDVISVPLTQGMHTLRLKQTSGNGAPWDYISMKITRCNSN